MEYQYLQRLHAGGDGSAFRIFFRRLHGWPSTAQALAIIGRMTR